MFTFLLVVELMSGIFQTVIKTITRGTISHFSLKCLFQFAGVISEVPAENTILSPFFISTSKISGNIKVFIEVIASFLFFRIFNSTIPVGLEMELTFFVQLHIQFRITGIHTSFNTIFHQLILAACLRIFVSVLAHTSESKERPEAQSCCRMRIKQSITKPRPGCALGGKRSHAVSGGPT